MAPFGKAPTPYYDDDAASYQHRLADYVDWHCGAARYIDTVVGPTAWATTYFVPAIITHALLTGTAAVPAWLWVAGPAAVLASLPAVLVVRFIERRLILRNSRGQLLEAALQD